MWMHLLGMGLSERQIASAMDVAAGFPESKMTINRTGLAGEQPTSASEWAGRAWEAERAGDLANAFHDYNIAAGIDAPEWVFTRQMAVAVAVGQWAVAARACQRLMELGGDDGMLRVTLGGLLLQAGHRDEAASAFMAAIEQLGHSDTPEAEDETMVPQASDMTQPARDGCAVQRMANRGLEHLQAGRFEYAGAMFEKALSRTDLLMQANAEWMLAEYDIQHELPPHLVESLITLGQTSDLLLQYMARTKLAGNLAQVLKARQLRGDLAAWATGLQEVQALLKSELAHLTGMLPKRANHAELHYRLGLLNRATGDLEAAAKAFRKVLTLHPHHAASAVRLTLTLLQLHRPDEALAALRGAMQISSAAARQYHALAIASREPGRFDRAIDALASDMGDDFAKAEVKANLAFALGAMGLMDEERGVWRNPCVGATHS